MIPKFPAVLAALLLLGLFTGPASFAQEKALADRNCAITLPEGWTWFPGPMPDPKIISMFGKPGETVMMVLVASNKPGNHEPMDDQFVADFNKGIESSGGKHISGKPVTVGGLKAYEWIGTIKAEGTEISAISQIIPTEGPCYVIQAMRPAGDAATDPIIRQAFESFHFITPPKPPGERVSSAERMGEMWGRLIVCLFAAVIVLIVLGAIVYGIVCLCRRK